MNFSIKKVFVIISLIFFSNLISQTETIPPSGKDYFTDDEGNVYMYVNILGHVKKPGAYLVYEGVDILTVLSQAGGALPGAKLEKVKLYTKDQGIVELNLESSLLSGDSLDIKVKPNDTIYIDQKIGSLILSKAGIINSALQIFNIYLTIVRTQ